MRSFLTALQDGRLIELAENDKEKALQLLASMIEAIPGVKPGLDIVGGVLAREKQSNTGLGNGWACPHARGPGGGELCCAIGWSPAGIDYGAADGAPVHVIVLYFVPESAKIAYLKEVSGLAKAIQGNEDLKGLRTVKELGVLRHRLLDLVGGSLGLATPDAIARMIHLETRVAEAAGQPGVPGLPVSLPDGIIPCWIIFDPQKGVVVLSQDAALIADVEAAAHMVPALARQPSVDVAGYRVYVRQTSSFQSNRTLYDCVAVRMPVKPAPVK